MVQKRSHETNDILARVQGFRDNAVARRSSAEAVQASEEVTGPIDARVLRARLDAKERAQCAEYNRQQRTQTHRLAPGERPDEFPAGKFPAISEEMLEEAQPFAPPRIARYQGQSAEVNFGAQSPYDANPPEKMQSSNPISESLQRIIDDFGFLNRDPYRQPLSEEELMRNTKANIDNAQAMLAQKTDERSREWNDRLSQLKEQLRGTDRAVILQTIGRAIDELQ